MYDPDSTSAGARALLPKMFVVEDLQSADVARGSFLLMAQLADAREESLRWCSPQRVSAILLQHPESDRCCR